jgi:hypothetical protein
MKSEFYGKYAKKINPDLQVDCFGKNFYDEEVQQAFSQMDIILGCVDSGARFSANRLSLANLIPYFDMGAKISRDKEKLEYKGGQIVSIIPGRCVCLECSGLFKGLKTEFWSKSKKERERSQGYVNDDEVVNPLVAHLDDVIAGLGYHMMLSYVWGQQTENHFALYCDMVKNSLMATDSSSDGCILCQRDGYLGMGNKVNFLVPDDSHELIDGVPEMV